MLEIKKASHFCEAFTSVGPEGFEPFLQNLSIYHGL